MLEDGAEELREELTEFTSRKRKSSAQILYNLSKLPILTVSIWFHYVGSQGKKIFLPYSVFQTRLETVNVLTSGIYRSINVSTHYLSKASVLRVDCYTCLWAPQGHPFFLHWLKDLLSLECPPFLSKSYFHCNFHLDLNFLSSSLSISFSKLIIICNNRTNII